MSNLGKEGCGVRIVGIVERKFVPPSGKCAFMTISWLGEKAKRIKMEMVAFGDNIVAVGGLGVGETIQVLATLDTKPLKNKAREDVQVDGRTAWVPQVIVRTIQQEAKAPPKTTTWERETPDAKPKGLSVEQQSAKDGVDW